MAFENLVKKCPYCDMENRPKTGEVLDSGFVLYKYECDRCGWPYSERRKLPSLITPLWNFKMKSNG